MVRRLPQHPSNGSYIPQRLRSIYLYSKRQLNEARLHADPAPLEVMQGLLGDLREAWHQIAFATVEPLAA